MTTYDNQFGPSRVSVNHPDISPISDHQDDVFTGSDSEVTADVIHLVVPGQSRLSAFAARCYCGSSSNNNVRAYISLAVLSSVNLLNYMDRYTVAGEVQFIALLEPLREFNGLFFHRCSSVVYQYVDMPDKRLISCIYLRKMYLY